MKWYKVAETSAEKANFLLIDMSYYLDFLEVKKITGQPESFMAYVDCKKNLLTEYMLESEREQKTLFGYSFFLNKHKFIRYKLEVKKIIEKVDTFKNYIDKLDYKTIRLSEIKNIVQKGVRLYNRATALYLISQPEYTSEIGISTREQLAQWVSGRSIEKTFGILVLPEKGSCLRKERYDWLEKIAIPTVSKFGTFKQAIGNLKTIKIVEKFVEKYKYYSASAEFGLWNKSHYLKLLKSDFNEGRKSLKNELSDIKNKKIIIRKKKTKLIKKYKIDGKLIKRIKTISELGVLRIDLRVKGWQSFNYLLPKLIDISAAKLKINKGIINNLNYSKFIELLTCPKKFRTKIGFPKNKQNMLCLIYQNKYKIYLGRAAGIKFKSETGRAKLKKVTNLIGIVANNGNRRIIKGKVFLFNWGSRNFNERIYKFPEGRILVAGQTRPLLMPAIRKAEAIITDEGGLLCHAAIVSRELGIPCIIGTKIATRVLKDGDLVEVDAKKGVVKVLKKTKC